MTARPATRREIWAWAMFDFANSGYTTVVITAIFNAWFVAVVAGNAPWATFAWTAALAVSYALVMLAGPVLGAYADLHARKKRLLAWTTAGCMAGTLALAWSAEQGLAWAVIFLIVSNACFGLGENLIAAFLPEIADERSLGRVSGWGWGLGYLGGMLTLGLCLAWIEWARSAGIATGEAIPATLVITAVMFGLSSLPTFLVLRERARPAPGAHAVRVLPLVAARLRETLASAGHYRDLSRFLVCIVCYQAGVQTVIALAAIYATQALGFDQRDTIVLILVVNLTAAVGALGFGHLQDRLGHVRAIGLTLIIWVITVGVAWAATERGTFWLAANLAGLALGASQSAGRALVGFLSPPARTAEFFGLWGLAVKLSSVLGPLTYGLVTWVSGNNHRLAMLVTGVFFLAGLVLLLGVSPERGRRAALAGEASAWPGERDD